MLMYIYNAVTQALQTVHQQGHPSIFARMIHHQASSKQLKSTSASVCRNVERQALMCADTHLHTSSSELNTNEAEKQGFIRTARSDLEVINPIIQLQDEPYHIHYFPHISTHMQPSQSLAPERQNYICTRTLCTLPQRLQLALDPQAMHATPCIENLFVSKVSPSQSASIHSTL